MAAAQQALADQKSAGPGAVEPADIFGRIDATFRDHQRRTAIASLIILEQPLGDGDICHEGMQVAIVDPDDFRTGAIGCAQFNLIMNFNQRLKTQLTRRRIKRMQVGFFKHRCNQQDAVGACRARLMKLVDVEDEILAQDRQIDGRPHASQIFK